MAVEQVEGTLTSSHDQTGITNKLQKNHPEQPTGHQLERSLTTEDLGKKPHQHIETDT